MVGNSPPVNVRRVGERHKIVRKTDSDFGVDAQAGPGVPRVLINLAHQVSPHDLVMGGISPESPSSTEALLVRPPCHGWDLPCWFLAQSKLFIEGKKLKPLSCV